MADTDDPLVAVVPRRGRGAASNPVGRFEPLRPEAVDDGWGSADEPAAPRRTAVAVEHCRTIISRNDSPEVPFEQSINPYRGCEHGCVYCFARPSHAYLGLSPGLDFESLLTAKTNAAAALRRELARPGYRCTPISLGANTDPYQPIERRYRITREILELLAACRHPVTIVTKSALVERDLDLLAPMAAEGLAAVYVSVTTLDRSLARRMEPRAGAPQRRVEAIRRLHAAGVPTGVLMAPVIPGLNDAEIESLLAEVAAAGARSAGYVFLRLPHEVKDLFREWLDTHYPLRAAHVTSLLRQARGGRDNDPRFGARMRGEGAYADLVAQRFAQACRRLGLSSGHDELDCSRFRPPAADGQLELF